MSSSHADRPTDPRHLSPTDLRAAVQLAMHATFGATDLTEAVHQSVRRTLGMRSGTTRDRATGLTGWVYRTVRRITRAAGTSTRRVLERAEPLLPMPEAATPERTAFLSILNGVLGDHLAADQNPLAIPMQLLPSPAASPSTALTATEKASPQPTLTRPTSAGPMSAGPLLVFIHGLCLSEQCWNADDPERPADGLLPRRLANETGGTIIFARYNTGRSIAANGLALADLLEHWLAAPTRSDRPVLLIGHSMGGRIADEALRTAGRRDAQWLHRVTDVVYLGTPHRGAPLERIGHHVDVLLESIPYARPFAALGTLRSQGIMDLRHGPATDTLPAPDADHNERRSIRRHLVAASLAKDRSTLLDATIGDGLVPIRSALGLRAPAASRHVVYQTGHLALLRSPAVADYLSKNVAESLQEDIKS